MFEVSPRLHRCPPSLVCEACHFLNMTDSINSVDSATFQVGDVVETKYGVGVLVEARPSHDIWALRLWRLPGKSVATAALAYLHKSVVRIILYRQK